MCPRQPQPEHHSGLEEPGVQNPGRCSGAPAQPPCPSSVGAGPWHPRPEAEDRSSLTAGAVGRVHGEPGSWIKGRSLFLGATVAKPNKPQATLVVCGPQAPSQVSPAPPGAPRGTVPQALPLLCPLASPRSVAGFPGFRGWPPQVPWLVNALPGLCPHRRPESAPLGARALGFPLVPRAVLLDQGLSCFSVTLSEPPTPAKSLLPTEGTFWSVLRTSTRELGGHDLVPSTW